MRTGSSRRLWGLTFQQSDQQQQQQAGRHLQQANQSQAHGQQSSEMTAMRCERHNNGKHWLAASKAPTAAAPVVRHHTMHSCTARHPHLQLLLLQTLL